MRSILKINICSPWDKVSSVSFDFGRVSSSRKATKKSERVVLRFCKEVKF